MLRVNLKYNSKTEDIIPPSWPITAPSRAWREGEVEATASEEWNNMKVALHEACDNYVKLMSAPRENKDAPFQVESFDVRCDRVNRFGSDAMREACEASRGPSSTTLVVQHPGLRRFCQLLLTKGDFDPETIRASCEIGRDWDLKDAWALLRQQGSWPTFEAFLPSENPLPVCRFNVYLRVPHKALSLFQGLKQSVGPFLLPMPPHLLSMWETVRAESQLEFQQSFLNGKRVHVVLRLFKQKVSTNEPWEWTGECVRKKVDGSRQMFHYKNDDTVCGDIENGDVSWLLGTSICRLLRKQSYTCQRILERPDKTALQKLLSPLNRRKRRRLEAFENEQDPREEQSLIECFTHAPTNPQTNPPMNPQNEQHGQIYINAFLQLIGPLPKDCEWRLTICNQEEERLAEIKKTQSFFHLKIFMSHTIDDMHKAILFSTRTDENHPLYLLDIEEKLVVLNVSSSGESVTARQISGELWGERSFPLNLQATVSELHTELQHIDPEASLALVSPLGTRLQIDGTPLGVALGLA